MMGMLRETVKLAEGTAKGSRHRNQAGVLKIMKVREVRKEVD
jgi:hypothetical protein